MCVGVGVRGYDCRHARVWISLVPCYCAGLCCVVEYKLVALFWRSGLWLCVRMFVSVRLVLCPSVKLLSHVTKCCRLCACIVACVCMGGRLLSE
jgi:hypothetical protein